MSVTDPIGDMITRIRNGQMAKKSTVRTPASKFRVGVLNVLQREGFIRGYTQALSKTQKPEIEIELKYFEGSPVINKIQRVSKPGRRVYSSVSNLPRVSSGLGIYILSTSRGVLSDAEARQHRVGGELLCTVF